MQINSLLFIKHCFFRWDSQFPAEDSNKVLQLWDSQFSAEDSNKVLQLLNMRQTGIELRDCFIQNLLVSGVTSFHSPIKRNNQKLFTSTEP